MAFWITVGLPASSFNGLDFITPQLPTVIVRFPPSSWIWIPAVCVGSNVVRSPAKISMGPPLAPENTLSKFALLVGDGLVVNIQPGRAVTVKHGWPGHIEGDDYIAPAQVDAFGASLVNPEQQGAVAPPLVHHHKFLHSKPAGAHNVAAACLYKLS